MVMSYHVFISQGNHVCIWWIIQDEVSSVENVSFPERQAFFEENDSLLEVGFRIVRDTDCEINYKLQRIQISVEFIV